MKKQHGFTLAELIVVIVIVIGVCGWVWNIVKIAGSDAINAMVILRCIGVFIAPLGSVLGFL